MNDGDEINVQLTWCDEQYCFAVEKCQWHHFLFAAESQHDRDAFWDVRIERNNHVTRALNNVIITYDNISPNKGIAQEYYC